MAALYENPGPTRAEVDALPGLTVLEFGAPWCGYCRAAQGLIAGALADLTDVRHIKVEDGRGRALGRSFSVRQWPTVICMRDGKEIGRTVRPGTVDDVNAILIQAEHFA